MTRTDRNPLGRRARILGLPFAGFVIACGGGQSPAPSTPPASAPTPMAAATPAEDPFVAAHRRVAESKLLQGDPTAALEQIDEALAIDPASTPARAVRGQILFALSKYAEAIAEFDAALASLPPTPALLHTLGIAHRKIGDDGAAVRVFARALELEPTYADTAQQLARSHAARRDVEAAITAYEQARTLHPDDPTIPLELGKLLGEAGQLDRAQPLLEEARSRAPDDADAAFQLGLVLTRSGQRERAQVALEAAVALDEVHAMALFQLRQLALQAGDTATAETLWARYQRADEFARVQSDFLRRLQQRAQNPDRERQGRLHLALGMHQANHHHYRHAEQNFQKARMLRPLDIESHIMLARVQIQLGAIELARTTLERARELDPTSPDVALVERQLKGASGR